MSDLKTKFVQLALPYINEIKALVKDNKDLVVNQVTLGQIYGGMRDVISIATETSQLNSVYGISFRGYSIDKVYENLPKSIIRSSQPTPEIVFHLLLTGQIPDESTIKGISEDWHKRCNIPDHTYDIINKLPIDTHPMIQFATAISSMQTSSLFSKYYMQGIKKDQYWSYIYEDAMNLIASLPSLASYIYGRSYRGGKQITADSSLDWAGNLAHMLGDNDSSAISLFKEFMRLYCFIHSDHEGGNASAFTAHVVGSTLENPYGAFAAAMHSLSGPLHGLASQTAFSWIQDLITKFAHSPSKEELSKYISDSLDSGKLIPGYGHAVLKKTDPRFTAQMNFAKKYNMQSPELDMVWDVYDVAPTVLGQRAKIRNPYPNMDAHSGAMLHYLGIKETAFYTVLFGVARSLGIMSQQIWDRLFMHPLYRPDSVTSEWLVKNVINKNTK